MEPEAKKMRLRAFTQDKLTFQAVSEYVRDFFLRKRDQKDINILAGERIALDLAQDAFLALASEGKLLNSAEEERTNKGL